jgi:hypothetical protein
VLCIKPQDFGKQNQREDERDQIADDPADKKRDGSASTN